MIDAKKSRSKEFLNISLDFYMPETGAPMQQIEFSAKLVAKEKRDGSNGQMRKLQYISQVIIM